MDKIIIKREYFDNIKSAIDSLNEYFSSDFTKRNFPTVDDDNQLDGTVLSILSWLNNVEPEWIVDNSKMGETISDIADETENITGPDVMSKIPESTADKVYAVIGCRVLEKIANNFQAFNTLINGIYTFQLFTNPSQYTSEIELFSEPVQLYELNSVLNDDFQVTLFDPEKYVTGVFNNDQITLPSDMDQVDESERIKRGSDLKDVDIAVDDTTQEAAEINFFENSKVKDIRYSNNKWEISSQFKTKVKSLVSKLQSCENLTDVKNLFSSPSHPKPNEFSNTVIPFILTKAFSNPKKYTFKDTDSKSFKNYIDSYTSIIDKNNGAKRFQNYDIFSTFKTDKESTLKFIEDFLTLNLVNDESCGITNNILLTLFNIFDSHIYLNILYNEMPPSEKKNVSLDQFIKTTRARINKNSRNLMQGQEDNKIKTDNSVNDSETVSEYCTSVLHAFGDMTIDDIHTCESYLDLLHDEISTLGDAVYNEGMSQIGIDRFIGSSYYICEQENGELPTYIKNRMALSDDMSTEPPKQTITDVNLPPDVPTNPIPDLANSIDEKLNDESSNGLSGMLGKGYEGEGKHVVYNITFNNSFNRDSYNTRTNNNSKTINDSSTDKTVTNTNTTTTNDYSSNKDASSNKRTKTSSNYDSHNVRDSHHTVNRGSNNYNNSSGFEDTVADNVGNERFSNGLTVEEMFTIIEASEPLSDNTGAGDPPKEDSLTRSMDRDRKLLKHQQNAKRKVQKGINKSKAVLKPISRAKQWLTNLVESLISRDEDKVKAEIVERPSYRSALYKGSRLALKLGLVGVATTISGYLGVTVATVGALRAIDKNRLRKEVEDEFNTEIEIIDDKIKKYDADGSPEALKKKYELMRMRNKMAGIAVDARAGKISHPNNIA